MRWMAGLGIKLKPGRTSRYEKGVNGPITTADETSDSIAARNFIFEAAVAAKAHRPIDGIEAILDAKSDMGINLDGKKI